MNIRKFLSKTFFLLSATFLIFLSGFGCKQGDLAAVREIKQPVRIQWWGVFDDSDMFTDLFNAYQSLHPNVSITYRKLRYEEYERALLEGWAEEQGPDIFFIHNTWTSKYEPKIAPLPATIKMPVLLNPEKGIEKSAAVYRETKTLTPQDVKERFVSAVLNDAVRNNAIVGLPLSVDTLGLFYNHELFDQAKITTPPKTWTEVKDMVKKLTILDTAGTLLQSGINLGGSANNNRSVDILTLLMLQTGTQMMKEGRTGFHEGVWLESGELFSPGADALRFYTDFAKPTKEVYTWNSTLEEAQTLFATGRLGMFLGYSYQLPYLRTQGPKIDIGIAPVPHLNSDGTDAGRKEINFANYWLASVAKRSSHQAIAWDLVLFATSPEHATAYLDRARKPPALRSLIQRYAEDPDLKPFVNQLFTAQTWYRGRNPAAMETAMRTMIDAVVDSSKTVNDAINFCAQQINQTL
ncbi:MAG: extracellular solute-binding protein [Patescibacteria group bacterium]